MLIRKINPTMFSISRTALHDLPSCGGQTPRYQLEVVKMGVGSGEGLSDRRNATTQSSKACQLLPDLQVFPEMSDIHRNGFSAVGLSRASALSLNLVTQRLTEVEQRLRNDSFGCRSHA